MGTKGQLKLLYRHITDKDTLLWKKVNFKILKWFFLFLTGVEQSFLWGGLWRWRTNERWRTWGPTMYLDTQWGHDPASWKHLTPRLVKCERVNPMLMNSMHIHENYLTPNIYMWTLLVLNIPYGERNLAYQNSAFSLISSDFWDVTR